jgi:hypothetical protein
MVKLISGILHAGVEFYSDFNQETARGIFNRFVIALSLQVPAYLFSSKSNLNKNTDIEVGSNFLKQVRVS